MLPLSVLVLGWLVYLVGFALLMEEDKQDSVDRFDRLPHYITAAAPPLLVLVVVLHAAFMGLASALLGLLTALVSIAGFCGIGYVLYSCAVSMWLHLHPTSDKSILDVNCIVMFVGTLIISLSWMFIMVIWNYFTYQRQQWNGNENDDVVDEDGTPSTPPPAPSLPAPFAGVARKMAVVFLVMKVSTWCVLVSGIDKQSHNTSTAGGLEVTAGGLELSFDLWVACVVGILLVVTATMQAAAYGRASAMIGVLTAILGMLYQVCVGHLVLSISIAIYHQCSDNCSISTIPRYELYQLCGGGGGCVLWGCVLGLWPFYRKVEIEHVLSQHTVHQRRNDVLQHQYSEQLPLLYRSIRVE